jgi:N,N'-diacetyllegionaminate synthase
MSHKCFIVAEIGQAHDGSLGILHSYIDALASTGIDAVKFQTHIASAESSEFEPFRVNFSYEDRTRFDYWKRMEFSQEQWKGIKSHCEDVGLEFISSPFSQAAVDLLNSLGVEKFKIGSGEVANLLMLEKIAKTGKDIILSSGMSSYSELDSTMEFLKKYDNKITVMQCTTEYPTKPENLGLNVIKKLKDRYGTPVGFSDHSGTIYSSLAAVTLGAKMLEFHAVFDKKMFGPDSTSSLTMSQIKTLVEGVRYIEKSLNNNVEKDDNDKYSALKNIFEKSLCLSIDAKKGHVITFDDLEAKKPKGMGIDSKEYGNIIGKSLNKDFKKNSFINMDDLDG